MSSLGDAPVVNTGAFGIWKARRSTVGGPLDITAITRRCDRPGGGPAPRPRSIYRSSRRERVCLPRLMVRLAQDACGMAVVPAG
jgi:hypothetical protein